MQGSGLFDIKSTENSKLADIRLEAKDSGGVTRAGGLGFNADNNVTYLANGGAQVLNIDNNQRVGIGTVAPKRTLEVQSDVNETVFRGIAPDKKAILDIVKTNQGDTKFNNTFYSNGVAGDFIFSNGNVGINASNPGAKLDVNGDIKFNGDILPYASETFDIGSSSKKIKDIYLSASSLHIGNQNISVDSEETLLIPSGVRVGYTGGPKLSTDGSSLTISSAVNLDDKLTIAGKINLQGQDIFINAEDTLLLPSGVRVGYAGGPKLSTDGSSLTISSAVNLDDNLYVAGNLSVDGTVSTINSTTVTVDDKNIELGSVDNPTEDTANGGGITLRGATNKAITWRKSTASWDITEHLGIADGKYIFTDKIRARDSAGLLIQDDNGNGISISDGGSTSLSDSLSVAEGTTLSKTLSVGGAATLSDSLSVAEGTTLSKTLSVGTTLSVGGAATLSDSLSVAEGTTLSKTLSVGTTLSVGGAATLSDSLSVAEGTTLSKALSVGGAATLSNSLSVAEGTTLSKALSVGGAATLSNSLSVAEGTTLSKALSVGGIITISQNSAPSTKTNKLYNDGGDLFWNGVDIINSYSDLSSLTDTKISSLAAGNLLIYDSSNTEWVNSTLTAGSNVSISNADGAVTISSSHTWTDVGGPAYAAQNNGQVLKVQNGALTWASDLDEYVTPAGGASTQIQYNNNGNFAGSANLTFDGTNLSCKGDITAYASSDARLKNNILNISSPIEKIKQINGVNFEWSKDQSVYAGKDIGVIAQDIEKVLPEAVSEREDGYLAVKYEKIIPLLIEAIKDQQKEIEILKSKIK